MLKMQSRALALLLLFAELRAEAANGRFRARRCASKQFAALAKIDRWIQPALAL